METKRITSAFADKALSGGWTADSIECSLNNIEKIFTECNEELQAAGMSAINYSFQPEETGVPVLENVETIGEFGVLFRADYDRMKMKDKDINACIEACMKGREYDHKAYHPVEDFLRNRENRERKDCMM